MADLTAQNKWEPLATDNSDREKIWSKSRTFAGDVWFRFRRKPTAIAGFVIIIALTLFALVGPFCCFNKNENLYGGKEMLYTKV